jgi:plasmid stabilization system protein ParE
MARVCRDPARCRVECEPGLRRILLRGFPMSIIYREAARSVEVLAVAHHRLQPGRQDCGAP